jgi:hypothetical protein
MKLVFDLDLDDWQIFLREAWINSKDYQRRALRLQILIPVGFGLIGISLWMGGAPGTACVFITIAVAYLFFCRHLMKLMTMRANLRHMRREENRKLLGHRELEFTPEGVKSVSALSESFYKADAIQRVKETPDMLFLFIAELQAVIIPRAKITKEEWDAVGEFARKYYGKSK